MTERAIASLFLLGLLAGAAAWMRRRLARSPGDAELELRQRTALSRETGLALVRAQGEVLLVGWGREGVRLVARLGRERSP